MALDKRQQLSKLQHKALVRAALETRFNVPSDGTLQTMADEIELLMWDCKPSDVKTSQYGYAMRHFNGNVFQSLDLLDAKDYIDIINKAEIVSYQLERK